jgi:hypothetical protein
MVSDSGSSYRARLTKGYIADTRKEQRHLLGAYSFVASDSIDLADRGLLQAGAWNYLREEITVALECRRPVRISRDFEYQAPENMPDDMQANYISYLLARIINVAFGEQAAGISWEDKVLEWQSLEANLKIWKNRLPMSFNPYSTAPIAGNVFPSLWMLRPWHGKTSGETTPFPVSSPDELHSGSPAVLFCRRTSAGAFQPASVGQRPSHSSPRN